MKTLLVTGGAGFVGSHLCEKLISLGNKVICIDHFDNFYDPSIKEQNIKNIIANPLFTLYRYDIRDEKKMEEVFSSTNIDCVIHLAAMAGVRPSIQNPLLYEDVNVRGTNVLLEQAKNHHIKKFN